MSLKAIAILGGGLVKESGCWRTTNFDEGDRFGALGDRLRVVAGSCLHKENPDQWIIVSGGRGQAREGSDEPATAPIMKKELEELGVPADKIIEAVDNKNTHTQLAELREIAAKNNLESLVIISNRYHLPRLQAMIENFPRLSRLKAMLGEGGLELASAEEIILDRHPEIWKEIIDGAYESRAMKERIELENQGVEDIKAGKYKL